MAFPALKIERPVEKLERGRGGEIVSKKEEGSTSSESREEST